MFLRTSGRPRNGCPAGEGPWIRRSRLEHASSCTGEIRSCKDLPDSPPMEPVVYFPEIICFVRSWATRAGTVRRRTTAVHLSTSLKSVAEARETAERRSRKLSLDQSTRARGGAFGPGSPVAMAAPATRAGGFPEPLPYSLKPGDLPTLKVAGIDVTTGAVMTLTIQLPGTAGMDPETGMNTAW